MFTKILFFVIAVLVIQTLLTPKSQKKTQSRNIITKKLESNVIQIDRNR